MEINKIANTNTVKSGFAEMNSRQGNSGLPVVSRKSSSEGLPAVYQKPAVRNSVQSALPPSGITKTEAGRILKRITRNIRNSNKTNLGNSMSREKLQRIRLSIARHSNHISITRSGLSNLLRSRGDSSTPATVYRLDSPIAMGSEAPVGKTVETPEVYIEFVDGVMLKITRKPYQEPVVEASYNPESIAAGELVEPAGFVDQGNQAVRSSGENFQVEFDISPGDDNTFYRKMVKEKYSQLTPSETSHRAETHKSPQNYEEEYELIIPGDTDPDNFTFSFDEKPDWVGENPFGDNTPYESPFGDNTQYESPFGNNDDSVKFALTNDETLPDILKELLRDR